MKFTFLILSLGMLSLAISLLASIKARWALEDRVKILEDKVEDLQKE